MKKLTKILLVIFGITFISGGLLCIIAFAGGASLYDANRRMPSGWRIWPFSFGIVTSESATVWEDVVTPETPPAVPPVDAAEVPEEAATPGAPPAAHPVDAAGVPEGAATPGTAPSSSQTDSAEWREHAGTPETDLAYSAANVDKMELKANNAAISLLLYDGDSIKVYTEGIEQGQFSCKLEGRTLDMKETSNISLFQPSGTSDRIIEILIPRGKSFESCSVKAGAGTVYLEQMIANKLELEAGAGDIRADSIDVRKLEADCGVGQIAITGTVRGDVEADCGVGSLSFQLTGQETDYNYELDCGMGEILLNGNRYSSLATKKEINNRAPRTFQIGCGVGTVEVAFH